MTPPPTDYTGFVGSTGASLQNHQTNKSNNITTATARVVCLPASASVATVVPQFSQVTITNPSLAPQLTPAFANSGHLHDGAVGKGTGTVIVLFRSDLRVHDHPALAHAVEDAAKIIPLYCFDPRHFGRTDGGFQKTGKYRVRFLQESVQDLRNSLRKKGSELVVRHGQPEQVIPDLCKRYGARAVFMHREVVYEDQKVEERLQKNLKQAGKELQLFWANTLYHEEDLPFSVERMPDVYSDFREIVEKNGTVRTPIPTPDQYPSLPRGIDSGEIPTLSALGVPDTPVNKYQSSGVSAITGGESEAIQRVASYVQSTKRLDSELNPRAKVTSHLGADFSCRISPWLAMGCISPRRIFDEMKKISNGSKSLYRSSTYFELVWRDFFRYITAKYSYKRFAAQSRTPLPRQNAQAKVL